MGYVRILIVFLASYTTPGLGLLLLGKFKRFGLIYFLCLLFSLPTYILLRLVAEFFPTAFAPSIGVALLLFAIVFAWGILASVKLAAKIENQKKAITWKLGALALTVAVANSLLGTWMQNYTRSHLFEGLSLHKGQGLAPRILEAERVLIVQPLQGIQKGQIALVRNPEDTQQRLLLEVAGLEGDLVVTGEHEFEVPKDQVLLHYNHGDKKYFGPISLDNLEGVAQQIYWSRDPQGNIRWPRIFTVL